MLTGNTALAAENKLITENFVAYEKKYKEMMSLILMGDGDIFTPLQSFVLAREEQRAKLSPEEIQANEKKAKEIYHSFKESNNSLGQLFILKYELFKFLTDEFIDDKRLRNARVAPAHCPKLYSHSAVNKAPLKKQLQTEATPLTLLNSAYTFLLQGKSLTRIGRRRKAKNIINHLPDLISYLIAAYLLQSDDKLKTDITSFMNWMRAKSYNDEQSRINAYIYLLHISTDARFLAYKDFKALLRDSGFHDALLTEFLKKRVATASSELIQTKLNEMAPHFLRTINTNFPYEASPQFAKKHGLFTRMATKLVTVITDDKDEAADLVAGLKENKGQIKEELRDLHAEIADELRSTCQPS